MRNLCVATAALLSSSQAVAQVDEVFRCVISGDDWTSGYRLERAEACDRGPVFDFANCYHITSIHVDGNYEDTRSYEGYCASESEEGTKFKCTFQTYERVEVLSAEADNTFHRHVYYFADFDEQPFSRSRTGRCR